MRLSESFILTTNLAVANELRFKDPRTFRDNYMDQYPPDKTNKQLKWGKQTTVDRIKSIYRLGKIEVFSTTGIIFA